MPENANHNFDIKTIVDKISTLNEQHSILDKLLTVKMINALIEKINK